MSDREDLIEKAAKALYSHRQSIGDFPDGLTDWSDLPEDWQEEWREAADTALPVVVRHITDRIRAEHSEHPTCPKLCLECTDHENVWWPCGWIAWADGLDAEFGVQR